MKKTIRELIAECGMVPSDIVKLSDGRLSIGQASVWLRDFKLSMPAELLLEWYCRRKVEEGVGPLPVGRKKSVAAEIFSEQRPNSLSKEFIQRMRGELPAEESDILASTVVFAPTTDESYEGSKDMLVKLDEMGQLPAEEYPNWNVGHMNIEMDLSKRPAFTTDATKKVDLSEKKIPAMPSLVTPEIEQMSVLISHAKKEAVEVASIGASNPPSATPTNFASWGTNMTMKRVGNIVKLNVNDLSYTIDFEKAKSGFLVDGKKYLLSDFKEV